MNRIRISIDNPFRIKRKICNFMQFFQLIKSICSMSNTNTKTKLDGVLGLYDLKVTLADAVRALGNEVRLSEINESLSVQRRNHHAENLGVDAVRVDSTKKNSDVDNIELLVHDEDGRDLGWQPLYMFNVGDTLIGLAIKLRSHL